MSRAARVVLLGALALLIAAVATQTTVTPIARAQSATSPGAIGDLGTLTDFQAVVVPLGFAGSSSPMPDGSARWLGQRASDGAMVEAIGPEDALSEVTFELKVPIQADNSTQLQDLVTFLTTYSPAGEFFVIEALGMAPLASQDLTQTFDNRSVHVTATQGTDATDVRVEITPASGAASSGEPTFTLPTFAVPTFEIPSFEIPSFAIPSFASDADLAAKFPTSIDGQPVTDVQTYLFVDVLRFAGETEDQIAALAQSLTAFGMDLNTLSAGSARATVDETSVRLSAFRAPGADANDIVSHYNEIAAAINLALGEPAPSAPPTLTPGNVGGKNVTLSTDTDGAVTYVYASGDTLWSIDGVTEDQAAKILAALQ